MAGKRRAQPRNFKVVFEPDETGWHVYVPELQGCRTWGRNLAAARKNIREAISLFEEELGGKADQVARAAVFDEDVRVPRAIRAALARREKARTRAEAAAQKADEALGAAVRALGAQQIHARDIGEILSVPVASVRAVR